MKKKLVTLLAAAMMAVTGITVTAAAAPAAPAVQPQKSAAVIAPRADVLVWKYQISKDGKPQKRRWNETRGEWYDKEWIDMVAV